MIKLFRNFRKGLFSDHKISRYFLYAIGEILLVVIGILIALQINNWNEERKDNILENSYLKNIKNDLEKDTAQINRILLEHINSLSIINSIDSNVLKKEFHQPEQFSYFFDDLDTTDITYIFYRGYSYRPTDGTYYSLIADGKSGLIKNKGLYESIQEVYKELIPRIMSNYETLKQMEEAIHWHYPSEKKWWSYSDLKNAKDQTIFMHLSNFAEERYFYALTLSELKNKMKEIIESSE